MRGCKYKKKAPKGLGSLDVALPSIGQALVAIQGWRLMSRCVVRTPVTLAHKKLSLGQALFLGLLVLDDLQDVHGFSP